MNKRSAAIVAAGLVAVLALGGFAYSRGLIGPGVGVATAGERVSHLEPIVRTHTKRVVVHRSAPTPPPRIVYAQAASSGAMDQSGDDMYEGEGDEYEGQEESVQGEDPEGEDD